MDTGNKTLAQLAAEHNELKYVTLEVASKLSGYTKEYIERLCRTGKVDFRLWGNDQFVPELESLLKVTHTILVSYDGITYVNKEETYAPTISPTYGQSHGGAAPFPAVNSSESPPPAQENHETDRKEKFLFVGRSVVSNADTPRVVDHSGQIPANIQQTEPAPAQSEPLQAPEAIVQLRKHVEHAQPISSPSPFSVAAKRFEIKVTSEDDSVRQEEGYATPDPEHAIRPPLTVLHSEPVHIPIANADEEIVEEILPKESEIIPPTSAVSTPSPFSVPNSMLQNGVAPTVSNLPMIPERHDLLMMDPTPLSSSRSFQIVLVVAMMVLTSLFGWLTMTGAPEESQVAAVGVSRADQLGAVAGSFSDEVVVTHDDEKKTLTVQPIFKDKTGKHYEFLMIPVGK